MVIYGISANEHDASLAVIKDQEILFASHSERYSRVKNDPHLHPDLIDAAYAYGKPDLILWYERPFLKRMRKLYAGQYDGVTRTDGASYLKRYGFHAPVKYVGHHQSHAAAGYFTSGFSDAVVLVIDAIGEWSTISIWEANGTTLRKFWSQNYPHSLGLLYSAFTQRIGFKPNEEEYILMGMAALGKPIYTDLIRQDFVKDSPLPEFRLTQNVHRGIRDWRPELTDHANIAASIQKVTEDYLVNLVEWIAMDPDLKSKNLVLSGGVALNCVANTRISLHGEFDNVWIMPNPGDAGSSIGAVAAYMRRPLNWQSAYLGHDIARPFDRQGCLDALLAGEVVGVANGRAEFGPRALGNRSLITDPRGPETKNRVNKIKKREPFRPFAPIILEQYARDYFVMPRESSPYMQFVARVRRPDLFPAISHYDDTARVQTLNEAQNPVIYGLLMEWYKRTGCPMLLNTSLNIKGEPLVNTWDDALRFQALHGVRMF
jgi:carbamoyltransferase